VERTPKAVAAEGARRLGREVRGVEDGEGFNVKWGSGCDLHATHFLRSSADLNAVVRLVPADFGTW
jgi:hypothetical protein